MKRRKPGGGRKPLPPSERKVKFACLLHPSAVQLIRKASFVFGISQSLVVTRAVEKFTR